MASRLKNSSFSKLLVPSKSFPAILPNEYRGYLTRVFPHMDLKVIIILGRMIAGREGTNEARRRIRLLFVDFLPVALQV